MRKIIASLLAVVMVVCAFSTMSVSAAEGNLLAGLSYTVTTDATVNKADSGSMLTDGAMRGVGESAWNGDSAVDGVTVSWFGTGKTIEYTFTFAAATDVAVVVFKNVRIASNRTFGTTIINGGAPILSSSDVLVKTAVADAPLYGAEAPVDQYFDVTIPANLTGVTTLNVKLITDTYVCEYDEIEAYATAPVVDDPVESSEDAPAVSADDSADDVVSDDVSADDVVSDDVSADDVVSGDVSADDVVSGDVSADDVVSGDVSADDVVSGDVSADDVVSGDDSSEEEVVIPVAEITYVVTATENEDGTVTVSVALPEGILNGKVVLQTSADLAYVDGSASSPIMGTVNTLNVADNGIIVSFAAVSAYAEGSVVLTANYTLADGAELDASDLIVPTWNLGDGEVMVGTQADGDVEKVIVAIEEEVPVVSSDDIVESEESIDAPVSSDDPVVEPDVPNTGDLGIAVFAVLAVISAGAVVVLKKKA